MTQPDAPAAADAALAARRANSAGDRLGCGSGWTSPWDACRHRTGAPGRTGRASSLGPAAGDYPSSVARQDYAGTNNLDTNSRLLHELGGVSGLQPRWAPTRRMPATTTWRRRTRCSSPARTPPSHPVLFRRIGTSNARNPDLRLVVVDRAPPKPPEPPTCSCRSSRAATWRSSTACCLMMLWERADRRPATSPTHQRLARAAQRVREPRPGRHRRSAASAKTELILRRAGSPGWTAGPPRAAHALALLPGASAEPTARRRTRADPTTPGRRADQPPGAGPFSLTGQPNAMGMGAGRPANLPAQPIATQPIRTIVEAGGPSLNVEACPSAGRPAIGDVPGRADAGHPTRAVDRLPIPPNRCPTRPRCDADRSAGIS